MIKGKYDLQRKYEILKEYFNQRKRKRKRTQ